MKIKNYYKIQRGIPRKYMLPHPWNVYYGRQKAQAKLREEEFAISPAEWFNIWHESGVMQHRGRKIHQYSMVRIDQRESWSAKNCMIVRNRRQAHKHGYEILAGRGLTEWPRRFAVINGKEGGINGPTWQ